MSLTPKQAGGIGCLAEIAIAALGFWALNDEAARVSAAAYLILFVGPFLLLKWFLKKSDLWTPTVSTVAGPLFAAGCFLLAEFHPIKVDDGKEGEEPATAQKIARKTAEKVVDVASGACATRQKGTNDIASANGKAPATVPPGVKYDPEGTNAVSVAEALAELDELIGLAPVKAEVRKFVDFVKVAQQRKAAGLKVAPVSYHMVFTGNPGTGKTTVARMMAKIYRSLGILKRGHLVETDRGGLVAGYTGQTAIKTGKVIDFALDGVLFIDEAYSLVEGPQDSYGDEAISTLLKRMEDDRDRLIVIIAGYSHEMGRFLDANSGLKSRFNRYIEFPDYSAEELAAMFRLRAKKNQYALSEEAEKWLDPALRVWTRDRDRKFGNGRYVRNLFEKAIERHATRVSKIANPTPEQLKTLEMQDIGIKLKSKPQH